MTPLTHPAMTDIIDLVEMLDMMDIVNEKSIWSLQSISFDCIY